DYHCMIRHNNAYIF
nr:immunoglobulin light chain junction region [Macaca mulatta]MOV72308.1 immunoglobulin light chain junction region [Macaca mulatta]MOV72332.1 immunoglobulin light chain junction region [Macaca mulatta]MOV72533.1 immunoglobulin light chain junction region [Macaca mulatta]MOV72735.1 immunoglobulin light chain junction region [Macaca mulatta]